MGNNEKECVHNTVYFEAESDWNESLCDAENECEERYNEVLDAIISEIDSNNGEVTAEHIDGVQVEENYDESSSQIIYKVRRSGAIDYFVCYEEKTEKDIINDNIKKNIDILLNNLAKNVVDKNDMNVEDRILKAIRNRHPEGWDDTPDLRYHITTQWIGLKDLYVESGELIFEEEQYGLLPDKVTIESRNKTNCSERVLSETLKVVYREEKGDDIFFSRVLKSASTISANIKFKFIGGGVSSNRSLTVTNTRKESTKTVESREYTTPLQTSPWKKQTFKAIITQRQYRRPFKGRIKFSGNVIKKIVTNHCVAPIPTCHNANPPAWAWELYCIEEEVYDINTLLSDEERTIDISGYQDNITGANIDVQNIEVDAECTKPRKMISILNNDNIPETNKWDLIGRIFEKNE